MADENPANKRRGAWAHVFSGTQLAASVLLGVFGGLWLDGKLGTKPWLTLICSMLGIGGGLYQFIREFLQDEK
ncbi:MAG: AtpZ/AtpI family protein [Elusimicrobiota bacterium]